MENQNTSLEERAREKGLDPHEVCERAAIMEIDGELPRWMAERYALGEWKPSDSELLKYDREVR